MQELTGRKLSKYTITSLIGVGGMSHVYRAHDKAGKCDVAIKVLKEGISSSRVEDLIRFRREATTVSKLNHDNLVKVHEVGEHQQDNKMLNYIVMDLVEGQTLDERMKAKNTSGVAANEMSGLPRGGAGSVKDSIEIISQIARALDYVHNAGVIHRDLKPGNIIVTSNEGRRTRDEKNRPSEAVVLHPSSFVKLLDFGLSQVMELEKISDRNEIVGTFSYMSPEQSGIIRKSVDERSDLYSLGIIFYQLATGQLPFEGDSVAKILHQQIARKPEPPRQFSKDIPEIIEKMILKLLKKDPDERYQTAKGLLSDLERFQKGETSFTLGKNDRIARLTYHTRLIGREQEYNKLKELYDKASQGHGSVCLVGGEAGRGKSRLVEELRNYVIEHNGEFVGGKCFDQANKIPYQPFSESINEYINRINKLPEDEKNAYISHIKESLGELGEVICRLNSNMRDVLGKVPKLVPLDPERENNRFLMVASRFFQDLGSENRPVAIMLDDLQWSDEGTLTLLGEILETISQSHILILCTYRDNEVDETHSLIKLISTARKKEYPLEQMLLVNFDQKRISSMLSELLVSEVTDEIQELSNFIYQKSKGNPFFTLEIVRQLIDQEVLSQRENAWSIDKEKLGKIEVSANILDIVLKRINQLTPEQLKLYSTAAIIGRKFKINLLYELSELSKERIINLVDEGIALQLIEHGITGSDLLFVHDRIRDAFYHRIEHDVRKSIHFNIAQALEKVYADELESVLFDLAHHYTESGAEDKTLKYALPAAYTAKNGYANEEAVRYFKRCIAIFEHRKHEYNPECLSAKKSLVDVYVTSGMGELAVETAENILPQIEDLTEKVRLYSKIGEAWQKMGNWEKCSENITKALSLCGEYHPTTQVAVFKGILKQSLLTVLYELLPFVFKHSVSKKVSQIDREIIWIYNTIGWMTALSDGLYFAYLSLKMFTFAFRHIDISRELAVTYDMHAIICGCSTLFNRSLSYFQRSVEISQKFNDEWAIADASLMWAYTLCFMARFKESLIRANESKQLFEKVGDNYKLCFVYHALGDIYYHTADYPKAISAYNQYLQIGIKINDLYSIAAAQEHIAPCYLESGDFRRAEESLKNALLLSKRDANWFIYCAANGRLGYLEVERQNYEKAIEYLFEAKKYYERNIFMQDFVCSVYTYFAEACIGIYARKQAEGSLSKKERKSLSWNIRINLLKSYVVTRRWKNHYGGFLRVQGKFYALLNNNRKAEKYFMKAAMHAQKNNRRFEHARCLYEYGKTLVTQEQKENYTRQLYLEKAQIHLHEALDIFKEIGAKVYVKRCQDMLGPTMRASTKPSQMSEVESTTTQQRLTDKRELSSVITVSHHLSSILDLDVLLEKIMDVSIQVTGAERGYLFLYEEEQMQDTRSKMQDKDTSGVAANEVSGLPRGGLGKLQIAVSRNVEKDAYTTEEFAVSRTVIAGVEKSRQAKLIIDAGQDDSLKIQASVVRHGLRSIICVPLMVRDKMLGLVYLDNRMVGGLFSQNKLEVLKSVSIQAAISIENARLYKEVQDKARMEEELRLGHEIQQNLLPKDIPEVPGIKVYGLMEPAKEIGGDYYDFIVGARCQVKGEREERERAPEFIRVDKDQKTSLTPSTSHLSPSLKLDIIIGDVSGKGVGAGMIMTSTKGILENMSYENIGLKDKILSLNRSLIRITHQEKMITMLMLEWDAEERKLSYCGAGHEPMIVCRTNPNDQIPMTNENSEKKSGIQTIKAGGIMLGMIPDIDSMIDENELKVASGDKVLLYTDGITEARNEKGEFYTLERLQASASRHSEKPLEEMITAIKQDVRKYISTAEQYDDITLVGIEIL